MDRLTMKDRLTLAVDRKSADEMPVHANVRIERRGAAGNLLDVREVHNTVTTAGKAGAADQVLASPSLGVPTHMELGTGTGGTTKLAAYIVDSRTALTTKTRDGAVITVTCTFGAGVGTGAITEAGMFDSATQDAGNMWAYASFSAVNKAAGDSITATWTITFGG